MASIIHEHLKHLSPIDISSVPPSSSSSELSAYIRTALTHSQALVDSIPPPLPSSPPSSSTTTQPASSLSGITTATHIPPTDAPDASLTKPWGSPLKISAKDNPLSIAVYKLAAADRRGAWFARRSVHTGLGFARWKAALDSEFEESLAVQGTPGQGNVRGIGAEREVESRKVEGVGEVKVMLLTAKFPGPSTQREFVECLVSSTEAAGEEGEGKGKEGEKGGRRPRQYMLVSRPCKHPDAPEREGWVRGEYESVEFIREIPVERRSKAISTGSLPATVNGGGEDKAGETRTRDRSRADTDLVGAKGGKISVGDAEATIEANKANGQEMPPESSKGDTVDVHVGDNGELDPYPIEWIMITRSDPGGSVPKFMVERGTPSAIVSDAGKFLEWATQKQMPIQRDGAADDESESKATNGAEAAAGTATATAAARHAHTSSLTRTVTSYSSSSSSSSDSFVSAGSHTPTITAAGSSLSTASGTDKYAHQENELAQKLRSRKAKEDARLEEAKAKHGEREDKIRKAEEKRDRKHQEADNWYEKEIGKVQGRRSKDERKQAARERKEREKAEAGDAKLQMERLREENEHLRKEVERLKVGGEKQ